MPNRTEQIRIRKGGTATVVLERRARPKPPPPPPRPRIETPPPAEDLVPRVSVWPVELGSNYVETATPTGDGDATTITSSYQELDHEASVTVSDFDRRALTERLVTTLREVEVHGSGRRASSAMRLGAGTPETDGLLTALEFERDGHVTRGDLLGRTLEWSPRVSAAARAAEIAGHLARARAAAAEHPEDATDVPALEAALERTRLETFEVWDTFTGPRVGREGTYRPPLPDGYHQLGADSLRTHQPWRSWDLENYKTTERDFYGSTETPPIFATTGPGESSRHVVHLAAQQHLWTLQWKSVYLIGTWFFWTQITIANTGAFSDRLPFYPRPYSLAAAPSARADVVSEWTERKRAYNRMVNADFAIQVLNNPFFFLAFVFAVAGRWTLQQRDIPAGTLCAIVDSYYNGGPRVRRFVWRRATLHRPNVVLDSGPLNTGHVIGDDFIQVE